MSSLLRKCASFGYAVVIAIIIASTPATAQVDTGTILGTVKDASGAVVPRVKVVLTNKGTGVAQTAETDENGRYIFTPLKIGIYQVEVEAGGFKKALRSRIELNIQEQAVVDFGLETGDISQTVEVTAEAPLLQTTESSVGQAVSGQTINNLPLNGRDWTYLARLSAGVNIPQQGARAAGQFAANGTRPAQNNDLIDGIDNNTSNVDFLNGTAYVIKPPVDAIGEFKIQTNAFSAEFGRAGGAVLNATMKSGTNEFHGTLWEFLRNDKLDANNYGNNFRGIPNAKYQQNQFGGSLGGPIWRNKTFFFGDFEGTRIRQGRLVTASVPTAAQRASGYTNFSDLITRQGNTVRGTDPLGRTILQGTIFDPATTRQVTTGVVDPVTGIIAQRTGFVRDPFPGNIIPVGRLNPNAVKLINLYPAENFNQAGTVGNNYATIRNLTDDANSFDARVDHHFSDNDHIFGRYSFADIVRFRPGPFEGAADGGAYGDGDETVRTTGLAISYTHSFSLSLINETRLGLSREHSNRLPPLGNDTSDLPASFGIQGIPQVEGNGGLPPLNIGGLNRLGAVTWLVADRLSNTTQLTDNLTKVYKNHTFKGGVEYQYINFPWVGPPYARGNFNFDGNFTSAPALNDGSTGRAQFLLLPVPSTVPGLPGAVDFLGGVNQLQASPFGSIASNRNYWGLYFQDDWKVNSKLTLNLGLRWERFSLTNDTNYAQSNFVQVAGQKPRYIIPARRRDDPRVSQAFIDGLAASGIDLVYADEFGSGIGLVQKKNFGPRFGFAYQFTNKFVLRGGYGIYYGGFENRGGNPSLGYNYPFQFDFTLRSPNEVRPLVYPDGSLGTLERGLLGVPLDPSQVNPGGLNLRGIEFAYKTPYTQGYNLIAQYELGSRNSVEVGYVASLGRHIETFVGTNHIHTVLPPGQGLNAQNYVPFPIFARGSSLAATTGNSHYHALQAKFQRRFSRGLDALVSYTWSKTLTNAGDLLSNGGAGGFRGAGVLWMRDEMARASFDLRHGLIVSGNYELPIGRGKPFLSSLQGAGEAILGGWSMNWVFSYYTGQPQIIGCTVATTEGLGCNSLIIAEADPYLDKRDAQGYRVIWNTAAFTNPPRATTIGQTDLLPLGGGRTQLSGPPQRQLDFSVFKNIRFSERIRSEFRVEIFNLTNTPSFNIPNAGFQNTVFGRLDSQRNNPRQLQLALKVYF
ncbi:MAG: TonB-dependent receptor [Acidobacteria bacterium]|nr:TonB-dependent receptor [Acidobacteriota bacterium]